MDDYVKKVLLKFEPDESSLQGTMRKLEKLDLFSDDDIERIGKKLKDSISFEKSIDELEETLRILEQIGDKAGIARVEKEIEQLKKAMPKDRSEEKRQAQSTLKAFGKWTADSIKDFGDELSSRNSELAQAVGKGAEAFGTAFEVGTNLFSGIVSGDFDDLADSLKDIATSLVQSLAKLVGDALDEMDTILSANRLSNEDTRELAFRYGFNSAEVYAWQKANEYLGFRSEEDMLYATDSQRELFTKTFTEFAQKYNELYDSGTFDTLEEFEVEMKAMKDEFTLEIVTWFMDNKDTLKQLMHAVLDFTKTILSWLGALVKHSQGDFSTRSHLSAITTDYVQGSSLVNNNSNVNVTIDNSFTNVQKEDQTWLANAGQLTYQQVIRALGGTS